MLELSIAALAVFVKEQNPVIVSEPLTRFALSLIQSSWPRYGDLRASRVGVGVTGALASVMNTMN